MSRDEDLHELLDRQRFCCLEHSLDMLRSGFSANGSFAALALADAAHRLCGACRDASVKTVRGEVDVDNERQREVLRGQIGLLLAALNDLNADEREDEPASSRTWASGAPERTCSAWLRRWRRVVEGFAWWHSKSTPKRQATARVVARGDGKPAGLLSDGSLDRSERAHSMQVYVLGPFRVCVDGTFIRNWPRGKSRKVFQYLVCHRERSVTKERLMDLFWPESDGDAARNSLYVAIYGIRKVLRQCDPDFSYILYRETSYCLNPGMDLWLDRDDFLNNYRMFDRYRKNKDKIMFDFARQAIMVFENGGTNEGLDEGWALAENQDLKDKYGTMVRCLIDHRLSAGAYDEAIDLCNRALSVDPHDEEVHRHLMLCHYRKGRIHLALRQYGRCFDALNKDLGIVPGPQTVELFRQIRQRTASGPR